MNKTRGVAYCVIFIIGFLGISMWNFWLVTHVPTLQSGREPAEFNLPAEEIAIIARDGAKLSAWFISPPEKTEGAILLLHGYPAEKGDLLPIARELYPDFSILLLDLRSFGKSEGSYTTLGVIERTDVQKALDFLETRGYQKIGVFGFSLGGALALIAAAEDPRVNAVGAYAPFADIRTLGYETYRNIWVLKYPLVELMILWSHVWFGAPATDVSPVAAAPHISVPVILIHTKEDEQIAFSHAMRLSEALAGNSALETYFPEHGRHGELPSDFNRRLKDFFTRSL